MRIAHLLIAGDVAGGQLVALRLAQAARARGDDALFVVPSHGPFTHRAGREGFRVLVADVGRLHRVRGLLALRGLLRRERIDLLHTHTLAAANALARSAGRLAGVPVVSHLHIENHFRRATAPLLRTADNLTARLCTALIAVSQDTRRAYVRQGYPDAIDVIYNGVELDGGEPTSLRAELGIPEQAPLIGEVGRLCEVKGQRELIAALAELPDVHAVLVGSDLEQDGAYRLDLEREAARRGVRDRVYFAGGREDAAALLAELDVVALPSWTEGLPLVVLEAMARSRPVVATSVGGTPELVVDGETGLIVPPRDVESLAAALRRLLADADLCARLGENGYRRVLERFTADAMAERVLAVYDAALR